MKTGRKILTYLNSPYEFIKNVGQNGRPGLSISIVAAGSAFAGFVAPVAYYLVNRNDFPVSLDILNMMTIFLVSICTYPVACGILWLASRFAGSRCGFREIISTWGLSYIPTILCYMVVVAGECAFYYFIGNTVLKLLINTLFLLLLIWKAIFYFIEARAVLRIKGYRLAIATLAIGVLFALLMFINIQFGLISPML